MNMIKRRSEKRFIRKEVAIAVAMVFASFGTTVGANADFEVVADTVPDAPQPLPTLKDPAGIIDPELLATLNGLSDTTDEEYLEFEEEVIEQALGSDSADEPEFAAAVLTEEPLLTGGNAEDAGASTSGFQPTADDPGLTAGNVSSDDMISDASIESSVDSSVDSSVESSVESLQSSLEASDETGPMDSEIAEKLIESDSTTITGASIDPHLPPPELPEIVLEDERPQNLKFSDMLALALIDNPGIVMAAERVKQAVEQSNQIGAYRYPTVELISTVGPERNDQEAGRSDTIGKNVKLTITQQLYDGGTAKSSLERSDKLLSAAEAESQIELETLLLEIVINYIDYWRYQTDLIEAENFVTVMTDLVDKLDSMFKAGATSKLEVDFAKARVASARGARSEASASMNNAFSELEYLVPGLSRFTANSPEEFSDFILLSLEEYLEKGAASNSAFVTNQMNIEATELKIRGAKSLRKPVLNFEVSGSYIDDEGQKSEPRKKAAAKLLLNYTLYNGGLRRAGIRRAQSELRELQAERTLLERNVFREIDQSFNNITSSRLAYDAVNDEILAHEELQRLNRQNLALGTVNIMELIDVEERLFNARIRKSEVLASMYQEYFTLLVSAGFTEEILAKYELELATSQGG